MPITISGSTGIAGVDGSAGTPAVQGTDTNTGIAFPAADTVAVATGGTERMRVDSSGNVGIGTSSPGVRLQIEQNQAAYTYCDLVNITNGGGAIFRQIVRNIANTGTTSVDYAKLIGSGLAINNNDTNAANFTAFGVGGSERARIDSSGNVGIGTSAPNAAYRLDVSGTGRFTTGVVVGGGNAFQLIESTGNNSWKLNNNANNLTFTYNATERMRIDSSGYLLVGTTSSSYAYAGSSMRWLGTLHVSRDTTGNTNQVVFWNPNGQVGFINTDGTTTSYGTSSDYRLKYDVQPMLSGLSTIAALKPSTYKWNADNSYGEGFIAHELQAVIPQAVTGEKDAVNDDGSIKPQGVDYSKIVVHLVAAIQELKADNDAMKERIATLEAK